MRTERRTAITFAAGIVLAVASAMTIVSAQRGNPQDDPRTLALFDKTTRDARQFNRTLDVALGRNPNRNVNQLPIEDDVDQFVNQLIDTTSHLRDHYTRRQVINADVEEVLARGARIDAYMKRTQLASSAESNWLVVRADLDEIARTFNVGWNWATPRQPSPGPALYSRWGGTYQLDPERSDAPQRVADQATRGLDPNQRQRVQQNLINRLDPPDTISIDRAGRTVSIASSTAPRSTFDIDGVARTETAPNGNSITVRAAFYGDQLMVTTTGSRGNDYTVTFEPLDGGRTLRVSRRLEVTALNQPVEAHSYYHRTVDQPQWTVYRAPTPPPQSYDTYLVADRTMLTGRLNVALGNRTSHQGDRFSLTVSEPAAYRGAVIDGVVANMNTGKPGRYDLVFNFDRIRLNDGRTGQFEGVLSQVRTPDGTVISINTDGVLRADDRGGDALQRGAIGATFGAIIGAIAGGGKGAAIGAAIGGGAGAGSVFVEGRDLYLPPGTMVTVVAFSPRR